MFELNQNVAIKNWSYWTAGTITGETPKFWKVTATDSSKPILFRKEKKYSWQADDTRDSKGEGGVMLTLTPERQESINQTTAERSELRAKEDTARAERKAFDAREEAWRLTPDGLAQTARETDLAELEIVSDIDERSGDIFAQFRLVGQYQKNHADTISQRTYATVDVTRRIDVDWHTSERKYKAPTISMYSINDSAAYVRNMQPLITAALEYASTLEANTGKTVTTEGN